MKIWRLFGLFVSLSLLLAACGGGGDGGGSGNGGGGGGGTSYTGSTNQATIDNTNAADIATTAYQGGSIGGPLGLGVQTEGDGQIGRPHTLVLYQALENALSRIDLSDSAVSLAIQTINDSEQGGCGGTMSYIMTFDDVTGDLSGSLTFNSYCDGGVTLSGSVTFSGQLNLSTFAMQLNMSLNSLTANSGSDSFTVNGDMYMDLSGSAATVDMNMLLLDNNTSEVFQITNFSMTITEWSSYVDVNILSGRFYHPDYGYVDISTLAPLRIYFDDYWPFSGVIVATGANDTSSKLTVISSTQYQIEADVDGNGSYTDPVDYNSGPLNWADL